ncbi:MAG TPA: glycosyltransferase family 2 protein [Candidatus Krumholzibacteria bacterium]|nr:glycosyltransferase family 2 protein [Candidatus Krumholzibacteria bacterium]
MDHAPSLSIVVPVYNEREGLPRLLEEMVAAVGDDPATVEIIMVDDGSRDGTDEVLRQWRGRCPALRVLTFAENAGQSAAMACGFAHARADHVVALDGDGQSDPADIPRLAALLAEHDLVCGIRRRRRDTLAKRWGSRFANAARRAVTGDTIIDIGCSLKAFHREPLQRLRHFDGSHRFLPVLLALEGCTDIAQIEVNHRPRHGGRSKYSNLGRLARTWQDLLAVNWYQRRHIRYRLKDES